MDALRDNENAGAETISVGGDQLTFAVTNEASGGVLLAYEVQMGPGGGPPVLHHHAGFELCRVVDGEMTFYVEDDDGVVRRHSAGPGAVVPIPGGREHTIRNESAEEATAFVVFTPGAEMERFARAAAELERPEMEDVLRLAAEHGIEMTRPVAEVA
jgi:oxalate decarboxylase/phosphoglucose isomerase-like protein (cupin superfamily)